MKKSKQSKRTKTKSRKTTRKRTIKRISRKTNKKTHKKPVKRTTKKQTKRISRKTPRKKTIKATRKRTLNKKIPKKLKRTSRKIHKRVTKISKKSKNTEKEELTKWIGGGESVKDYKIIRIPSNVSNLDQKIDGGFIKNSTNLIVGGTGVGKSILATQFLMGGLKKGEKCLYVTFEEKKIEFYKNMKEFGWDLEKYEKKGLFTFLEYTPLKIKTMIEEGGGTIETTIINKKISRMVIDSITSFDLLYDSNLKKREAALSLFNMVRNWNVTTLLTLEGKPLREERMDTRTMEFESDAIILLYYVRSKGERHRYIEILKMRGTKHSKKIYRFHIGKGGISIFNKAISGIDI